MIIADLSLSEAPHSRLAPLLVVVVVLMAVSGFIGYQYIRLMQRHDGLRRKVLAQHKLGRIKRSKGAKRMEKLRKQASRTKELRRLLKLALEPSQLALVDVNIINQIIRWSKKAERIFELPTSDFNQAGLLDWGQFITRWVYQPDQHIPIEALEELAKRKTSYQYSFRVQMPDGRIKYISTNARAFWRAGKIWRMLGTLEDVSAKRLGQLEVENPQNYFQMAAEAARAMIYLQDSELRYISVHDALLNIPQDTAVGKTDYEIGLNPTQMRAFVEMKAKVLEDKKDGQIELWLDDPAGGRRFIRTYARYTTLNDGKPGVLGMAIDITELKEAQQAVYQNNRVLKEEKRRTDDTLVALMDEMNKRQADLDEARTLQLGMQPDRQGIDSRWDIAFGMQTCEEVGGDFVDVASLPNDGLMLAVGDATGHGMKAALMVSMVKSYFQCLSLTHTPGQVLATISRAIQGLKMNRMFMALTLVNLDEEGCTISSAGMPPILIYCASTGEVDTIGLKSIYLGTHIMHDFPSKQAQLNTGDIMLICTDGFSEVGNNAQQPLGMEKLADVLKKNASESAEKIKQELVALADSWRGDAPLRDDQSLMVVKIN